jgi:hypothetical protein
VTSPGAGRLISTDAPDEQTLGRFVFRGLFKVHRVFDVDEFNQT